MIFFMLVIILLMRMNRVDILSNMVYYKSYVSNMGEINDFS